eukprot:2294675-Pleurochrysis_carterae.AAC.6
MALTEVGLVKGCDLGTGVGRIRSSEEVVRERKLRRWLERGWGEDRFFHARRPLRKASWGLNSSSALGVATAINVDGAEADGVSADEADGVSADEALPGFAVASVTKLVRLYGLRACAQLVMCMRRDLAAATAEAAEWRLSGPVVVAVLAAIVAAATSAASEAAAAAAVVAVVVAVLSVVVVVMPTAMVVLSTELAAAAAELTVAAVAQQ